MASLIKTKTRLTSARSTQKVIKAMELVASSKIKRAREKAVGIEFYFNTTLDAMNNLYSYKKVKSLLLKGAGVNRTLIVSITSDMGLCGAYNGNVIKKTLQIMQQEGDYTNIVVGTKGISKLKYEKVELLNTYANIKTNGEQQLAIDISSAILTKHLEIPFDSIKIVYTKFINPLVQEVKVIDLLHLEAMIDETATTADLVVEPNEERVFYQLFEQYVISVVFSAVLNSFASEHAARRTSMEAANKNSLELIDDLNLELNRIRQSMITQEISEIIGGAEALNN
ncbi:MAG: ATP synthase F1 subunit gamma [Spiroplasma sp.]|nr:ATP synthase F1 subunit gamma [Mycoplasmatales bacterium]